MSKLPIRYFGHPDLRVKAEEIQEITPEVIKTIEDMIETMVSFDHCIGFAGPQLGVLLRVFVIREEDISDENRFTFKEPEVFINPILTQPSSKMVSMQEGCMSLPNLHVDVVRPQSVHVRYQNLKGEIKEEIAKDFRARMIMHENDHLNGVLHIDRMDKKKRKEIDSILRAMKKKYNP